MKIILPLVLLLFITMRVPSTGAQTLVSPTPAQEESTNPDSLAGDDAAEEISESESEQLSEDTPAEVKQKGAYWSAPDFSKQADAVGWSPTAFGSPPGFQKRVKFWTDVYTKYTTHQALIHDAQYLDIVYGVLDLSGIDNDQSLSLRAKERAKKKLVKEEKKKIREQLERIQKLADDPDKLAGGDLDLYKKFRFVYEKNKFRAAAARNRLRMQLGQKDRFLLGLYYSGRYLREMEKIFREEGVPVELTRLPFVESSFNLYAYSRVGASGIWQFMRSTGRLYLKIDRFRDMRNDPLSATRAAARLLRSNYRLLGSWPLALTAYNHGPRGVSTIVKKFHTEDINELVWNATRRKFGFASENFYAEFLAALQVESHAKEYFGKVEVSPALEYDELELPTSLKFTNFSALFGDGEKGVETARLYNPFLTKAVWQGKMALPKSFVLRVPKNQKSKFLAMIPN